jgi:hypothetical protein
MPIVASNNIKCSHKNKGRNKKVPWDVDSLRSGLSKRSLLFLILQSGYWKFADEENNEPIKWTFYFAANLA